LHMIFHTHYPILLLAIESMLEAVVSDVNNQTTVSVKSSCRFSTATLIQPLYTANKPIKRESLCNKLIDMRAISC
jgi:hypothetical protein